MPPRGQSFTSAASTGLYAGEQQLVINPVRVTVAHANPLALYTDSRSEGPKGSNAEKNFIQPRGGALRRTNPDVYPILP